MRCCARRPGAMVRDESRSGAARAGHRVEPGSPAPGYENGSVLSPARFQEGGLVGRIRSLGIAICIVLLLGVAAAIIALQAWHGPVVLALSADHGVDTGDLL